MLLLGLHLIALYDCADLCKEQTLGYRIRKHAIQGDLGASSQGNVLIVDAQRLLLKPYVQNAILSVTLGKQKFDSCYMSTLMYSDHMQIVHREVSAVMKLDTLESLLTCGSWQLDSGSLDNHMEI